MDTLTRAYRKKLKETTSQIHRFLYTQIDWSQPLIGIKGERGVGKTTMMMQRIKEIDPAGDKSFYATLDHIWFSQHTLIDLAEELVKRGVTHLYLDEVHRLPNWELQIKNLFDLYSELHVVFTGSSLLIIDNSIGDLSRRVSMHKLPGLSFREFVMFEEKKTLPRLTLQEVLFNHETLAPSLGAGWDVLPLFKKYLAKGYYPYYKTMMTNDYYSRLEQVLTAVIESDIVIVEKRIDYETLIKAKRLVYIISESLPYIPNMTSLAGVMGTSRNQLLKLFDLLDRAGIIRQLFAGSRSPKSLAKPQKILLGNSSLMNALGSPSVGAVRECAFASMVSAGHSVGYSKIGDAVVDGRYVVEIGGKGKGYAQIRNIPDSFVVADDIEYGFGNKIPLWLFGLLY